MRKMSMLTLCGVVAVPTAVDDLACLHTLTTSCILRKESDLLRCLLEVQM